MEFSEIIEQFVNDNFVAESCRECHENGNSIVPQDHKGSYEKALNELQLILGIKQ